MENKSLDTDGFITVSKKKSVKARRQKTNSLNLAVVDIECCLRSIEKAKLELTSSNFFPSFSSLVQEICAEVKKDITYIICLGIGAISSCKTAQYQLTLLLALKEELNCPVEVFDPIFSQSEREILDHLKLKISAQNTEGKIVVTPSSFTLFILPHCPKELINNIFFSNWSPEKLRNCIVYGNSLEKLKLNTPKRFLEPFHYLVNSDNIAEEIEVPNNFRFTDIFNDLSLHYFPDRLLSGVDSAFWDNPEPAYTSNSELIKEDGCAVDAEGLDS